MILAKCYLVYHISVFFSYIFYEVGRVNLKSGIVHLALRLNLLQIL